MRTDTKPPKKAAPKRTFLNLKRRLSQTGLERDFVHQVLRPQWWTKEDEKNPGLLSEVEFTVARFLKAPIETVRDPAAELVLPPNSAKLRKSKDLEESDVAPAVHTATMIAHAVVRNLKPGTPAHTKPLPDDPEQIRSELGEPPVTFRKLLSFLWVRGIPVLRVCTLPSPKFRGMACWAQDRPVIFLAWGGDDTPKHLNDLAHETGHVAKGHVSADSYTIDNESAAADDNADEREANAFQAALLYGESRWPDLSKLSSHLSSFDGTLIAREIHDKAKKQGIDAGLLAHCWIVKNRAFPKEKYILKVLDKLDAVQQLNDQMKYYIDFEGASETDASLLRCLLNEDCD